LRELGGFEDARRVLEEALLHAEAEGEPALLWRTRMELLRTRMRVEGGVAPELVSAEVDRALAGLSDTDEERTLAVAWRISAFAPWDQGKVAETEQALTQAIRHARRARDARTEELSINLLLGAGVLGPRPVAEAISHAEGVLAEAAEGSLLYADACRALCWLRAMQGDFDEARRFVRRDKAVLSDLSLDVSLAASAEVYGAVELLADRADLAEAEFRAGLDALSRMGEKRMMTELALRLALVLATRGQSDEASTLARMPTRQIANAGAAAQMQRCAVRAQLAVNDGRWQRAKRYAREACQVVATTELVVFRADALLLAARIHQAAGTAFAELARQARELYTAKDHLIGEQRAQALLAETAMTPDLANRSR
jgi:hypothetical protein